MEYQNTNRTRKCLSCKLVKCMSWDDQFGCLSKICKECENSEPPKFDELRCSQCYVVSNKNLFWDIKGTELLKTCEVCRISTRKYIHNPMILNKRASRSNAALQAQESARKSKSYSSSSTPPEHDFSMSLIWYDKEFEEDTDSSSSSF